MALTFQAAAPQLVEACQGAETVYSYFDSAKKVFVLVASGELAEHYRKVVDAARSLSEAEAQKTATLNGDSLSKARQGS